MEYGTDAIDQKGYMDTAHCSGQVLFNARGRFRFDFAAIVWTHECDQAFVNEANFDHTQMDCAKERENAMFENAHGAEEERVRLVVALEIRLAERIPTCT